MHDPSSNLLLNLLGCLLSLHSLLNVTAESLALLSGDRLLLLLRNKNFVPRIGVLRVKIWG